MNTWRGLLHSLHNAICSRSLNLELLFARSLADMADTWPKLQLVAFQTPWAVRCILINFCEPITSSRATCHSHAMKFRRKQRGFWTVQRALALLVVFIVTSLACLNITLPHTVDLDLSRFDIRKLTSSGNNIVDTSKLSSSDFACFLCDCRVLLPRLAHP